MTAKCVEHLVDSLPDKHMKGQALHALIPLADKCPKLVEPHADAIIKFMKKDQDWAGSGSKVLVSLAGNSAVSHKACGIKLVELQYNFR